MFQLTRSRAHHVVLLGISVLPGCSGQLTSSDTERREDEGAQAGEHGGADDTQAAEGHAPEGCELPAGIQAGPAPLRRLNRVEYENTIRDLFGIEGNSSKEFPPDATVDGFDNNIVSQAVTFELAGQYLAAAESLSRLIVNEFGRTELCGAASDDDTCARDFITQHGRRIFRRPVSEDELTSLLATYRSGQTISGHLTGIRLVLQRMLQSPHFVYRPEFSVTGTDDGGPVRLDPWELATRLSFLAWGSTPDEQLLDAAANGELETAEQIDQQVARLFGDPRARDNVKRFYAGWLQLDAIAQVDKDAVTYAGFGEVAPAMREEIARVLDHVVWEADGAAGDLFETDYTFVNRALATFLEFPMAKRPPGADVERIELDPTGEAGPLQRKGILSTAGILAAHSKPDETSPVKRGKFISEQILCLHVPAPPENVALEPQTPDTADLSTRERFSLHNQAACASCHRIMDPLGFAFEGFDTAGRWRATDKGKPVDTSGRLTGTDVDGDFAGAIDLTERIGRSADMQTCLARQYFRFASGRRETDEDERSITQLGCRARSRGGRLQDLFRAIANTDSFLYGTVDKGGMK